MSSSNVKVSTKKKATRIAVGGSRSNAVIQTSNGERKFIGGAAMARQAARKGTRIVRPDEKQRLEQPVSAKLNPFERFYAGLLRCSASDFLSSNETWQSICQRLRLPVPQGSLLPVYPDGKQHFLHRASLVMEEARYAVAEGLTKLDKRYQHSSAQHTNKHKHTHTHKDTLRVKLLNLDQRDQSGHTVVSFVQERPFTPEQIDCLKSGTIFACNPLNASLTIANSILASILPASREEMIENRKLTVMIFTSVPAKSVEWELTPLTSLVSHQRMFEACTSRLTLKIPFLHPLIGAKGSTHMRFDDEGETIAVVSKDGSHDDETLIPPDAVHKVFSVPTLNVTQEKAAQSFLNAETGTITLIQGPPGSGKTMLLVSVICRYVMESIEKGISRSIMVTAPTNKAVAVLCERFLEAIRKDQDFMPCNVLLIGDEDKLITDGFGREQKHRHSSEPSPLRSIFLYTWVQSILEDYGNIRRHLMSHQSRGEKWAFRLSRRLEGRLKRSLSLTQDLQQQLTVLTTCLEQHAVGVPVQRSTAIAAVQEIIQTIGEWKKEDIWQELLGSAHLIFCTLASSGTTIIKKGISEISDLIVDEAAAATEPEMYIPFQYRPERLLAVGDPKQLPATILSTVAGDLGLSKSLHERLMYDCHHKHIMLDVQYRMRPALSQFPSNRFYDAKLTNGQNVIRKDYRGPVHLLNDQPFSFLQVYGDERQAHSGSFENLAEAETVVNLVLELQRLSRRLPGKWHSHDRIRIITFYQAQVSLIKRMLHQRGCHHVLVATVDSSQGCEADIVIVSFVRSKNRSHKATVGFLSDDRRLNVAITRAKYQLICVGNAEYILKISTARADTVRCLTLDAYDRRCIIPHPSTRGVNAIERREKRPRDEYMDPVDSKKTKLTSGATSKSSDETLPPLSQKYTSSELKAFLQDDNSNNESESSSSCSSSSSSSSSSPTSSSSSSVVEHIIAVGTAEMPIMIDSPSPPERFSTRATSAMTKKEEEVPGIPPPSLNMKEAVKKCKLTAVTRSACIDSEYKNGFQRIGIKKEHTTSSTENVTTLLHPSSIVQQAAGICKDLRPPSMTSDATTIINNPVSISPSDIDFKSEEQVEPSAIERDSVIAKEEERLSNASENENYDENPGMFVKAEIDHEVENGYVDIEV